MELANIPQDFLPQTHFSDLPNSIRKNAVPVAAQKSKSRNVFSIDI